MFMVKIYLLLEAIALVVLAKLQRIANFFLYFNRVSTGRKLGQVFPYPLRNFWDEWGVRGMIIISIMSQIILLHLGSRRRKQTSSLTKFLVWSSYIIADKVAIFALGVIAGKLGDYYYQCEQKPNINPQLMSLWASFFLLHLGGPDTITAYTLEDNELWQRHLIGLVLQTGLVIYIIILSWERSSSFSHISILMLIIGFFKYAERTLCLYSSSIKTHSNSLVSYVSQIDSHRSNSNANYRSNGTFFEHLLQPFLHLFVSLFVDVVLSVQDLNKSMLHFESISPSDAFAIVEAELQLAYDVFYTKSSVANTAKGMILRFTAFLVTIGLCYYLLLSSLTRIHESRVDWILTIMLTATATYLEYFSFQFVLTARGIVFPPTRTRRRLRAAPLYLQRERERTRSVIERRDHSYATMVSRLLRLSIRESWSNKLGQCNLLSLYAENNNVIFGIPFPIKKLENILPVTFSPVSVDLKKIIYNCLQKKSKAIRDGTFPDGGRVRDSIHHIRAEFQWTNIQWTERFEFHQSILIWHIATDLCYHFDDDNESNRIKSSLECKQLSDYMFFLLVKSRYMLPVGTGMVRFYDTCAEAIKYFHQVKQFAGNQCEAFKMLVESGGIDLANRQRDKGTKSVFLHARKLSKSLLEKDRESLWKFLTDVWVVILSYAAAHCRVDNHAQQLRRGGEFLSHVWLLQAHMGLLEQLQVMEDDVTEEDMTV